MPWGAELQRPCPDWSSRLGSPATNVDRATRPAARCRTETPPPSLTPIFTRLGELAAQLPPGGSHDLRHYLQRRSYEKARLWLEGVDPEKGTCRK